jgi:hypothetical protein
MILSEKVLVMIYPGMRPFPSVGASGFPDLISRQAFCGGSLGLRHQYVYELLQGTPLEKGYTSLVFHPAPISLPRIHLLCYDIN